MEGKLSKTYELLVKLIIDNQDNFPEERISVFNSAKGELYQNKVLVVGRAPNGWNDFPKNQLSKYLEEIKKNLEVDNLQWVVDQWGSPDEYNPQQSAFWRVSREISKYFHPDSIDPINCLAWTNLYKVSKAMRGNPSNKLCDVQLDICKSILIMEVTLFKPKYIVFLTGWGWAKWFIEDLPNTFSIKHGGNIFVEASGTIDGVKFVVGQHPQCKEEALHVKEIIEGLIGCN